MTFSEALIEAMTARGVTCADLAAMTRLHTQTIVNARRGPSTPKPQSVAVIATALDAPHLVALGNRPRRRPCEICGQRFTSTSTDTNRRRFCSRKCQQTAYGRRHAVGRATVERAARNKVTETLRAIEMFCYRCEPVTRLCSDGECELRAFSPLPLAKVRIA